MEQLSTLKHSYYITISDEVLSYIKKSIKGTNEIKYEKHPLGYYSRICFQKAACVLVAVMTNDK